LVFTTVKFGCAGIVIRESVYRERVEKGKGA
jgi:hypothetical protein